MQCERSGFGFSVLEKYDSVYVGLTGSKPATEIITLLLKLLSHFFYAEHESALSASASLTTILLFMFQLN